MDVSHLLCSKFELDIFLFQGYKDNFAWPSSSQLPGSPRGEYLLFCEVQGSGVWVSWLGWFVNHASCRPLKRRQLLKGSMSLQQIAGRSTLSGCAARATQDLPPATQVDELNTVKCTAAMWFLTDKSSH